MNRFDQVLADHSISLTRKKPAILQVNTGKICNLTCLHCHVNAGPRRKEIMTRETVDRILAWFEKTDIPTLDLTGGTPEMIPDFRHVVETVRSWELPRTVMTRLNATIIEEEGYDWIPEFHTQNKVVIIASMPCYSPENVNQQRGHGVFDKSIRAFQRLNELGYGRDPGLVINFVYNPNGAFLPGDQAELEADYKYEMKKHFDIDFNQLFCITNMPIQRFASYLRARKMLQEYMDLLADAFNPSSIESLMCRDTISVGWQGEVYDCDFNQQMNLQLRKGEPFYLWDVDAERFSEIPILTGPHCFGCTAGAGSSCGGALTE
ncbi:MAG: arsenosugar biosynthesis radical SAM (seleno)protein ArsS [Verrucomicrobiota bacterium]